MKELNIKEENMKFKPRPRGRPLTKGEKQFLTNVYDKSKLNMRNLKIVKNPHAEVSNDAKFLWPISLFFNFSTSWAFQVHSCLSKCGLPFFF